MKKIIYLSAALMFALVSCEQSNNGTTNDDTLIVTNDQSNLSALVSTTYEDLIQEKVKLEKELMELKNEKNLRAGTMAKEFDNLTAKLDAKLQAMENKATQYRDAAEDQKEVIEKEFEVLEEQASEEIEYIKDNFKKKD
ncbi:hypothetical protein P872_24810 [Rhodonellum psychrophilum GCM71 = DSM 17998]|uniref:Uncharacterized protein n=2 Tax=Rhodonellum TaxID=336827 RepID=U5C6Q3_9BACT|nr:MULTISPECIES: hypothetical protein [Rhodonellum]ERM84641.1 hypothetical protein P872_24810 [Rhodonellum psychrophilum GCM71 = DSM 17998]